MAQQTYKAFQTYRREYHNKDKKKSNSNLDEDF